MKLNMYNVKKFLMKHKYFILLVVLLTLFFVFLLPSFREGLANAAIGEYTYLAPVPAGNTWDQSTMDKFAKKYNEVNNKTGDAMIKGNAEVLKDFFPFALNAEVNYYIQNGKWPYCSYVSTYVEKHPEEIGIGTGKDPSGNPITIEFFKKLFPNRFIYANYIGPREKDMTPQPLSYQIFMGTAKPPSTSSSAASSSPASSLSDTNYQQLVTLCKNVMGNQK
jgi:hypothetical protein